MLFFSLKFFTLATTTLEHQRGEDNNGCNDGTDEGRGGRGRRLGCRCAGAGRRRWGAHEWGSQRWAAGGRHGGRRAGVPGRVRAGVDAGNVALHERERCSVRGRNRCRERDNQTAVSQQANLHRLVDLVSNGRREGRADWGLLRESLLRDGAVVAGERQRVRQNRRRRCWRDGDGRHSRWQRLHGVRGVGADRGPVRDVARRPNRVVERVARIGCA